VPAGRAAFVAESPSPNPFVGELLDGRYRIVREIAAGGMSTVYEATHVKIGRKVAIKVLHREMAGDPEAVARFINEARAVGTFGHPNIVASTDFGELPGHVPFLVLEYLEGRTLAKDIAATGPLPVRRMVRIALQVASALDAAHSCGVVHRDLTSDNVFLVHSEGNPDHVKVLDFGISKFLTTTDFSPKTRRGLTMGTPEFMAPEQISDPQAVDARADIYALGVISYQMLAGWPPFGRLPLQSLLTQIVIEPPPPIDRPGIPDGLRAIVMKALAKDPSDRFANMQEMGIALEQYGSLVFSNEGFSGRVTMPVPDLPTPAPTRPVIGTTSRAERLAGATGPLAAQVGSAAHSAASALPTSATGQPYSGVVTAPPETKRRSGLIAGLMLLAAAGAAGGYFLLHPPERAPTPAPVVASPPPAPAPGPAEPAPIHFRIASRTPAARVTFRGRTHLLPLAEDGTPGTQPEAVEVTAPGKEGLRFWITFDRPFQLASDLHDGHGVADATAEETLVALGGPVVGGPPPSTGGHLDGKRAVAPIHHLARSKPGFMPTSTPITAQPAASAAEPSPRPPATDHASPTAAEASDTQAAPEPGARKPVGAERALSTVTPPANGAPNAALTTTPTTIAAGGHPASRPGLAPQTSVPAGAAVATRRQPPGAVDAAKTQMVVRSHLPEIQRCYERGKMDDPDLRGRVTVRIAISANGTVSDARIDGSTLGNGGVEGCMTSAVRSWKFPTPTAGGAVISYPFNLR